MAVKEKRVRRLSRAEAQANTRARLLDAAEEAFAAEGYGGASLDRIAEAAGLTRGAVYSNFADKADLFVAVLHRRLERRRDEVAATIEAADDPQRFLATLDSPDWRMAAKSEESRRWMLLRDEFRLFALRNPSAAVYLAEHERVERDFYVAAIRHLLAQLGVVPPADERLVAAMIMALDEGLIRQHLIDPDDVAESAFVSALDLLLRAAAALGTTGPRAGGRDGHRPRRRATKR